LALLRVTICRERAPDADRTVLEAVLVAAESIVTFRRRYRGRTGVDALFELLVIDSFNPARSPTSCSASGSICARCPTRRRRPDLYGCSTAWPNGFAPAIQSLWQNLRRVVGPSWMIFCSGFSGSCAACQRQSVISICSNHRHSGRCSVQMR
jgi:hypothetical protein